jgi:short-subunit dehydrogenase
MSTALVTGASGGIGEAFARLLAERGHDLVMVARRGERLQRMADDLSGAHRVSVETIVADLCDPVELGLVEARLLDRKRPIEMLVNNAGAGTAGPFATTSVDRHVDQLTLNITAVVRLTHAAVTAMTPRQAGGILNVSSLGGLAPAPRFATYVAAKAFVANFSQSLHEELKSEGIRVTCLCPGATRTDFGDSSGASGEDLPSFAWMSATAVAHAGLAALDRNAAICIPGRLNKTLGVFAHVAPRGVVRRVSGLIASRV